MQRPSSRQAGKTGTELTKYRTRDGTSLRSQPPLGEAEFPATVFGRRKNRRRVWRNRVFNLEPARVRKKSITPCDSAPPLKTETRLPEADGRR